MVQIQIRGNSQTLNMHSVNGLQVSGLLMEHLVDVYAKGIYEGGNARHKGAYS